MKKNKKYLGQKLCFTLLMMAIIISRVWETLIYNLFISVSHEVPFFFYYFSTDFDWSIGNDFIVSASSDGSYRLWKSSSGKCLRIIADTSGSMANCSCFHSQNGNFLIVCDLATL